MRWIFGLALLVLTLGSSLGKLVGVQYSTTSGIVTSSLMIYDDTGKELTLKTVVDEFDNDDDLTIYNNLCLTHVNRHGQVAFFFSHGTNRLVEIPLNVSKLDPVVHVLQDHQILSVTEVGVVTTSDNQTYLSDWSGTTLELPDLDSKWPVVGSDGVLIYRTNNLYQLATNSTTEPFKCLTGPPVYGFVVNSTLSVIYDSGDDYQLLRARLQSGTVTECERTLIKIPENSMILTATRTRNGDVMIVTDSSWYLMSREGVILKEMNNKPVSCLASF